eukprot:TRINITY_DN6174_c0_g1_i1.p1 TRINITY_DN6174_c0_g1~~TRINITY_DN6174_c0_g1_i1.p1  ORF type:complete len:427 (-),score=67.11 TRINITY_DN6174_c0_g1_i1:11-1291(-)
MSTRGEYVTAAWLATTRRTSFPKFYRVPCRPINNGAKLMFIGPFNGRLALLYFDVKQLKFTEIVNLQIADEQQFDPEMIHHECFVKNNSYFLLRNGPTSAKEHVFMFCPTADNTLYGIANYDTSPTKARFLYSGVIPEKDTFRLFLFGGLDLYTMEPLDTLEAFDVSTFRWETISTKGRGPTARHSAAMVCNGQQIFIFGGSQSVDLFSPKGDDIPDDIFILDYISLSWTIVRPCGAAPRSLAHYYIGVDESSSKALFIWGDVHHEEPEARVATLDLHSYVWKEVEPATPSPDFRVGASFAFIPETGTIYLYGGFNIRQAETEAFEGELDRLVVSKKKVELVQADLFASTRSREKIPFDSNALISAERSPGELREVSPLDNPMLSSPDAEEELDFERLLEIEKKLEEEEKLKEATERKKKSKKRVT